ncbi:MAG: hypothetical protein IT373_26440 [Polyangiaceae bacterium]|nr:hypothetical protein [Polyangiaceae bacterium]
MHPVRLAVFLLALLAGALAPRVAAAESRVLWSSVEVRAGDDAQRVGERLRTALRRASRHAKWGKGRHLVLSARVTHFDWERGDGVLRLSCTVVARIGGGQGARSRIRMGGRPEERAKLEKQVLGIVANGLVTRLSELARAER